MIFSFVLLRRVLLLLGVSVLTACGAVGTGNVPVLLQIQPPGSSLGTSATRAYQCASDQLSGFLTFSDGTVNNFTGRITWSSDNPAVVSVGANTGILAPQTPGSATITATYYTLQASIKVEVSALTNAALSLQKLDQNSYSLIGSGGFTIATNTAVAGRGQVPATQNVVLVASESASVKRNVTGSTTFALTDSTGVAVPVSTVATSQSTTVYALTAGSALSRVPYTLTATLGACSSPLTLSVLLNVANVSSLTLRPETDPTSGPALGFADGSGNPLPLMRLYGVERLGLTANFVGGQTQDVSLYGQFTSSVPTVAAFDFDTIPGGITAGAGDILTTLNSTAAAGTTTTTVSATFQDGSAMSTSNPLTFKVIDGTLQSLAVAPSTGSITATSTAEIAQFHAIGTFAVGAGTVPQDMTRLSTFSIFADSTSDTISTNLAAIASTPSVFSGLALPANNDTAADIAGGTVYIGASNTTGSGSTSATVTAPTRATLTVNPQPDAPAP